MSIHKRLKTNRFLNYKTILSILLSILGIWLGFRNFNFKKFAAAFMSINLYYFFTAMVVIIFTVYLRAWRWKYLVMPIKKVSVFELFKVEMVGYFGNNVFPLKMGEVLRAYTLGKNEEISAVSAFGTIVNERLMDTLVFAFFIGLGVIIFPDFPEWIHTAGMVGIISLGIFLLIIVLLNFHKKFIENVWLKIKQKYDHKPFFQHINSLVEGLTTLFNTPYFLLIAILSMLIWGVTIANFWLLGMCLDISFSLSDVILIFIVTSAVFAVPAAPGYIGTYHAGAVNILLYLGISNANAQVLAVIMHGVGYISMTLIGLFYFLKYNINVKEVQRTEITEG